MEFGGEKIRFTISCGVAFGKNHSSLEELISAADELVYKAKENGRNRLEIEEYKKTARILTNIAKIVQ